MILSVLIGILGIVLAIPTISDLISIVRAMPRGKKPESLRPDSLPSLVFLVPAHDEELLIESCVASLLALDYPAECRRLVVIADNCTDRTAARARGAGAEVHVRNDPKRRGKPYALAWAFERLGIDAHAAVIIVDADSLVDTGFAKAMAAHVNLGNRAIQGVHGVRNPSASPVTRMAALLSTIHYCYMYPLRARAGLSVPLTGNGMCIGTSILRSRGWRAFSIAEDTELYVDLTRGGYRVEIEPAAIVRSQEARSLRQGRTQRTRWRAGRLDILRRTGFQLFSAKELGFHQRLDVLGELLVPGPAVHFGGVILLGAVVGVLRLPGESFLLALLATPILRWGMYILLALRDQREPLRTIAALLYLPIYLVWRMAIEVTAIRVHGQQPWVRTERHSDEREARAADE